MNITCSDELPLRRPLKAGYWMLVLVIIGTIGYRLVEGWDITDCFFMTVITVSTVGYGETHVLSDHGRVFTSILIFVSLVSVAGCTAILTSFFVECDLGGHFQRRRTDRMISAMKNHTIVCGSGLMAYSVIERLMRKRADVVMIASDLERVAIIRKKYRRLQVIEGNPSNELNLAKANVLSASHVVAATDSEVDNLLIGITCKDMGHNIAVIAESNDPSIANRMRKSGIDEVISPIQLGGQRVAELILA
jgi:voltage-gated potassium channel